MPFSFKPTISPSGTPEGSSSFGLGTDDLMARAEIGGISIIQVVVYFIFGAACLLTAVLFGYKYYLNSQIENVKSEISIKEQELSKFPIADMNALSMRIRAINDLLREHPYVNAAFRILEDSVENNITYKTFNLTYVQGKYSLVVQAISPDYKSIAQQVDTLSGAPYNIYIPSIKVEGLAPDKDGSISFSMEMPISITGVLPEDINFSYGASLRASSTASSSVATTTNSTATASTTSSSSTGTSTGPVLTR